MRPLSCVCVRSAAPVSSSPGVLSHAPETNVSRETPHVRRLPQAFSRPIEAPRPRPLRPPPGPASSPRVRTPPRLPLAPPRPRLPAPRPSRPRASRVLVPRSRSRPGLRLSPARRPRAPHLASPAPGSSSRSRPPARRPRAPGFCIRAVRRLPRRSLSLRFRCQDSLNLSAIN